MIHRFLFRFRFVRRLLEPLLAVPCEDVVHNPSTLRTHSSTQATTQTTKYGKGAVYNEVWQHSTGKPLA